MTTSILGLVPLLALAVPTLAMQLEHSTGANALQQVIDLLSGLKSTIEQEGTEESTTYNEFACFCKTTSESKSGSIQSEGRSIDQHSSTIQVSTSERALKGTELVERRQKQDKLGESLSTSKAECEKQKAEYEATSADLAKAISSSESAVAALRSSKPTLLSVRRAVSKTRALADMVRLLGKEKAVVSSFLELFAGVEPKNATYKFHSQHVIDILDDLLQSFREKKDEVDAEFGKSSQSCTKLQQGLTSQMEANLQAMGQLETDIANLKSTIATARGDLVASKEALQNDQLYMQELTARCEARANDWDQRAKMRAQELAAITEAHDILVNNVSTPNVSTPAGGAGTNFLQLGLTDNRHRTDGGVLLGRSQRRLSATTTPLARISRGGQAEAVALLRAEGQRLESVALVGLATRAQGDPFAKVKNLIQRLIERLLAESAEEGRKKGFCDTEVGKAKRDRDFRMQETRRLMAEIVTLHAKQDKLVEDIQTIEGDIQGLNEALNQTAILRAEDHKENVKVINQAMSDKKAVMQAISILTDFYKGASRAKVLLQASPVDEDAPDAGFKGGYRGKQESSRAIFGLLEVIAEDFGRTARETTAMEKQAAAAHVLFDRQSKASIGTKETQKTLEEEELRTAQLTSKSKHTDVETSMALVDEAIKILESLKPVCIDTGMRYADRVDKREEEVAALRRALCILDPEGAESDCASGKGASAF